MQKPTLIMTSSTQKLKYKFANFIKLKVQVFLHLLMVWTALNLNLLASYGRICWCHFVPKI